ncbi:hypothetical protein SEVIR_5G410251v4 [Setaria viridis]
MDDGTAPTRGAMDSAGRNRARGGMSRRRRPEGRRGPGRRRGLAAGEAGPAVERNGRSAGARPRLGPGRRCTRHQQGAVGNLGRPKARHAGSAMAPACCGGCRGRQLEARGRRPVPGWLARLDRGRGGRQGCRVGGGRLRLALGSGVPPAVGGWVLARRWQRQWQPALTGMLSPRLQDRPGPPPRGIRSHSNSWCPRRRFAGNKQPMHGGRRICSSTGISYWATGGVAV